MYFRAVKLNLRNKLNVFNIIIFQQICQILHFYCFF